MARVTHICLSDLHLGAKTAILTDTPGPKPDDPPLSADPLRQAFAKALEATLSTLNGHTAPVHRPSLVLLGDIMDFSLAKPKDSIESFRAFLQAIKEANGPEWLGSSIFVPGNHDHELWTVARFNAMAQAPEKETSYLHATKAFDDPAGMPRAAIIDPILKREGFPGAVTFYPNIGLQSADGRKTVVLHHGHFLESMYRAMSGLTAVLDGDPVAPFDVETLEKQNSSWIDFVWSNFGDDGKLGAEIRLGYDYLLTGREDIVFDRRLGALLARKMQSVLPLPSTAAARQWTGAAADVVVNSLLGEYGQMDRFSYFVPLGADATAGLKDYLARTVRTQLRDEDKAQFTDLTFIFGHTHKPFEDRLPLPGFSRPPAIYNTGGWDLDMPMFGTLLGAAAVFVDDDLNVASLRLCSVPKEEDGASPPVGVMTADGTVAGNPLAQDLQNAVQVNAMLWNSFSAEATKAYRAKQAFIFRKMAKADRRDKKHKRAL